ncbi:O-linked N-acetylglucosamine transferase, SPINDLY family protein [Marivita geojedonensis]|uniref:O-linked N-acetylglucosamine transferase, SPINDLY family protein n=1 Tax=Marivita geojedonensis TaxID=1123756 RepID=UPI000A1F53D5|nr:hypothetical protein [Marivita geojedonensis]PRY73903.1 putative O-linked N-acetylglucosamine transferase (SPINDLY family) [Marivita geojedonensis]
MALELVNAQPKNAEAWAALAAQYCAGSLYVEGARSFRRAAKLTKGEKAADNWTEAGAAAVLAKKPKAALSDYANALKANKHHEQAITNRMVLSFDLGDQTSALSDARLIKSVAYKLENLLKAYRVFIVNKQYLDAAQTMVRAFSLHKKEKIRWAMDLSDWVEKMEWEAVQTLTREIYALYRDGCTYSIGEPHFVHLNVSDDPDLYIKMAKQLSNVLFGQTDPKTVSKPIDSTKRLKIGYLSSDFTDHPLNIILIGALEYHDKHKFEFYFYDNSQDLRPTSYRKRFLQLSENIRYIGKMADPEVVSLIKKDEIDILVDLNGHTKHNRLSVLKDRPAPIQASYLGFPGTLGTNFVDYMITDKVVTPDGSENCFSEKLVRLPETYFCSDNKRLVAKNRPSRADVGLDESAFVFCSFNRSIKISQACFEGWAHALKVVDNSQIWLNVRQEQIRNTILSRFGEHGISRDRVVFAHLEPLPIHISRLGLADLGLDTYPYNGHTTTSDLLWAGVPIVGFPGNQFASRVTVSLLKAAWLEELIASDRDDALRLTIELAQDKERLSRIRAKLIMNRLSCPLFDTERFTRHLEAAYLAMAADAGSEKAPLDISALPARQHLHTSTFPFVNINAVHVD